MLCIISAELFCQDLKIQGCGMLWEAVMKRWAREQKHKNVIREHNVLRIAKA